MSDSLWPNEHVRLPCPSLSPGVCSDSCSLSQWCHPTHSSSATPSSPALNLSQHQDLSNDLTLWFRWLKYWSFRNSPSNEYSELISFRIDWFDLSCQESFPAPQFKSISSSRLSLLYGLTLTSVNDYWKNHSFDYMDLYQQSDVSTFNMLSRFLIVFLPRSRCL